MTEMELLTAKQSGSVMVCGGFTSLGPEQIAIV